ncbi:hypothetical protein LCGC14_1254150, partial [marine sediment metagenome]
MRTYTQIKDKVGSNLRDTGFANFATTELDEELVDAIWEVSQFFPHERMETYTIESRVGTASSTSSGNLVDATKSQFLAGDVGKMVFNSRDKTWAEIVTFTSSTTVALSKDIMASGETYEIYNNECTSKFQINISDVTDYLGINKLEYPKGQKRNYDIDGTILTVKVDSVRDSKVVTSGTQPDTEVYIWFKVKQRVSQLTDFLGAVDLVAGYSAGDTSIVIDDLQSAGTIEADQEFTIAGTRGIYRVTADATIASNEATVTFYPGLESDVINDVVVTFTQSTLTNPMIELYVIEYATALAAIREPMQFYQQIHAAITTIALATTAITGIAARITQGITDIASGRTQAALAPAAIVLANAEFDLMNAQIDLAVTALAEGEPLANTVPVAGGAPEFMAQAGSDINAAQGFFASGRSYLNEASADLSNANTYTGVVSGELQAGTAKIREAQVNLQEVSSELQIASSGRIMEASGLAGLERVKAKLRRSVPRKYRTSQVYT